MKKSPIRPLLSVQDAMNLLKGSGITYMAQYQRYYSEHNLKDLGFPFNPKLTYGEEFPGVDAFFGNPEGTAVETVRQLQSISANKIKPWKHIRKGTQKRKRRTTTISQMPVLPVYQAKTEVITPSVQPVQSEESTLLSFSSIIDILHREYNIPVDLLSNLTKTAKRTSRLKIETCNEVLEFLLEIAMNKVSQKAQV